MEYRKLGNSDVKVSAVAFGAWAIGGWMWGPQDDRQAVLAIRKAVDLGVTTIDTAPVYGFGHSEELVAEAVRDLPRDRVQLLTKFGMRWDTDKGSVRWETADLAGRPIKVVRNATPQGIEKEINDSLRRLATDYVDLYQQHWPDPDTPVEETMRAIEKLLKAGKIRAAGVCNYDVPGLAVALKIIPLVSCQPPYSMVNRAAEKDIIPFCIEKNIAVLPYSPLQRGLLTGKIGPGRKFAPGDHRSTNAFFRPANVEAVNRMVEEFRPIAAAHGATVAQLAINWTARQKGITSVLAGARNPEQAQENAHSPDFILSDGEINRINQLLEGLKLDL
ncbi:MAG: aldo/keto reductase [Planctomycetes bacterium]|nr:aldo/keto reductase [Planctomycetota bacterium]